MNAWKKITCLFLVFVISMLVSLFVFKAIYDAWDKVNEEGAIREVGKVKLIIPNGSFIPTLSRKLLLLHDYNGTINTGLGKRFGSNSTSGPGLGSGLGSKSTNRMDEGACGCTDDDIEVDQQQTKPMPNGIPTYTVVINNLCDDESCSISNIHLHCGWFSSARLIDPSVFRRVGYDDCLLNDGAPLPSGGWISFMYANTYPYPLEVASASC
ncbi:unnamed protein product [Cuscuta epithymum]|uniref:Uncharacterized protein n=1 Tax=Cuscuta epithymum TaxID=186058 RepID=A0AAV0CPE0_9ASTE|nr:unnamed protein product [Cuscuta epithymum]